MKKIYFKDFITLQRGFDLPRQQMRSGQYPVVGSTSIIGFHNEFKVAPPGVVTGRSGSLGTVQYVTKNYWPHNTSLWVKDFKGNHPKYVYYFLQTLQLERFNSGVGVPTLNRNDLDKLEIQLHDIASQNKIANILSAYDDLIENNTHRIQILEEMAQAIYREWFVRFRYPGHEGVRMVQSEMGEIPEGWEVVKLGSVAQINPSQINKNNEPKAIQYIDIASVTTGKIENIVEYHFSKAPGRAKRIVKHGDTIWSTVRPNRKSFALIIHPLQNLIVSTGFAVIRPVHAPFTYIYLSTTTDDFTGYLTNHATGAAYPAVNQQDFSDSIILLPIQDLLEKFHQITEPIFLLRESLSRKNDNLRRQRDLLLPRLVSGELDVSSLDV